MDLKLSLNVISKHYQVSTFPVRQALEGLIREKVILKEKNGRLKINPELQKLDLQLDEVVKPIDYFDKISKELIHKSLSQESGYIREIDTAKQYDISQTIVREIFGKCHGYGLLEHVPRKGWKLRTFQQQDFLDYCTVRLMMEQKAVDLSKSRLDKNKLEHYLNQNDYDEPRDCYLIDEGFHRYVVECSENRYIIDFFERNSPYFEVISTWEAKMPGQDKVTCLQHRDILNHLIAGNWELAKEALANNILHNHPYLFKT
jgi:DNA-binding GntR family transcriptional regulator